MSMVQLYDAKIEKCILHFVGNKSLDIECNVSSSEIALDKDLKFVLTNYFFKSFMSKEDFYHFQHNSDLALNEVFIYASRIFESRDNFIEQSHNILNFLYGCSCHPKIKIGELYVVYFTDCLVDGNYVDAIGIFKSEHKDTFIKITQQGASYGIESLKGINVNKLDKGCIIYNIQKSSGYLVSVVDNSNVGEAKYWVNDFLNVKLINDDFAKTQSMISLGNNFLRQLSFESPSEKVILMNKGMKALASDNLSIADFSSKVFENPSSRKLFEEYSKHYQEEHDINLEDSFVPSKAVLNKKKNSIKRSSTIHLDNHFDIRILDGEGFLEQGYDEMRGQKFYKLFFDQER